MSGGASADSDVGRLRDLGACIRSWILQQTNLAGSGHATSSLSAVELMTGLVFGGHFRYDPAEPGHPNNDRLIFSKGHASPLFYALWAAAEAIPTSELTGYRKLGSRLEGHPALTFPYTEAATGSLGQGLSIGLGMALAARYLDDLDYRTWVLLGDSEMAEGSQWEAVQLAAHYRQDNLFGVLDVNRLGQRGETMYGHDLDAYRRRFDAFGWATVCVADGHDLPAVLAAYRRATSGPDRPTMVIAGTVKGKGVPSAEDSEGLHGKPLGEEALTEGKKVWGPYDQTVRGGIARPVDRRPQPAIPAAIGQIGYRPGDEAATRDGYGSGLVRIAPAHPEVVVLDGEVCNSTRARAFRDAYPERYFEMFVAEQNMVGTAIGLARRGKRPFVSTFAAFLTRAADQIRMSRHSDVGIVFAGSHAGVSIGPDGPSQMGLEDLALFRPLLDSVILYPADAVAAERTVETALAQSGLVYLRLTRGATPVVYEPTEHFPVGGSKVLRSGGAADVATILSAGYTLHEALAAHDILAAEGLSVRVVDLYSVKPLDLATLITAVRETGNLVVVEDHYAAGGIGEAVLSALAGGDTPFGFRHLAVHKHPGSGDSGAVLREQGLTRESIASTVRELRG